MPAHWTVTSDDDLGAADIAPVAQQLGADVSALRNTVYDISGKRMQLNTIVAATATDADRIMTALGNMKSEEFFLRRELIIYEFVCADNAIADMRAGRALLE